MKSQKLEQLLAGLSELKAAVQNPHLYIYQHFSDLKNQIDVECQQFLCSQADLQSTASAQCIDYQDQMIDEVESHEKACLENCQFLDLNEESVKRTIESTEAELKSLLALEDKRVGEINLLVEETVYYVKRELFLNRSLLFVPRSMNLALDVENFGVLLVIADEFIAEKTLFNR